MEKCGRQKVSKERTWPLAPAIRMLWETAEKNMAANLRTDRSCETLW